VNITAFDLKGRKTVHITIVSSKFRLALPLLMVAMLFGCGPGDDKKKVEPAPPAKTTPPPAPPKAEPAPAPKPVPKKAEAAPNPGEGWVLLGQQQVDRTTEKDRFSIGKGRGAYRELRVIVQGAPVTIEGMTVTFGNDREFKPEVRHEFTSKASTRSIDLPGDNKRSIKYVDFIYRTKTTGGDKATVYLYGR
jgi:hypothetical protein